VAYRHEQKYIITEAEAALLATRLRLTLPLDPHAVKTGGSYHIRSLYFDDLYDSAVGEKVAGENIRDKVRIRIYNLGEKGTKLERKHKNGPYIKKESLPLKRAEAEALVAGDFGFLFRRPEAFAKEMYAAFRLRALRPKVLVDYMREPFLFCLEDVRVTLDRDIRTGYRCTGLYDKHTPTMPAQEFAQCCILEVKYNRFLPSYVRSLLQVNAAQRAAASKYVYCRQFEF